MGYALGLAPIIQGPITEATKYGGRLGLVLTTITSSPAPHDYSITSIVHTMDKAQLSNAGHLTGEGHAWGFHLLRIRFASNENLRTFRSDPRLQYEQRLITPRGPIH